jgi:hypothetical protein
MPDTDVWRASEDLVDDGFEVILVQTVLRGGEPGIVTSEEEYVSFQL